LQIAAPREIYARPANRAVARFVGLSTLLPAKVCATDRIDLGFTEWVVPTGGRRIGTQVYALVRPEHVQPDPAPGTWNRMIGRSGAQRYFGAVTRYDFHVQGTQTLFLAEAARPAAEAIAVVPEQVCLLDD
jgi:putative spermidine/putrescine transport system ATP-binding protein